jgi:hypothetical protein
MPPKTSFVSENILRQTPLPNHGKKYVTIAHGAIIDKTRENLQDAGLIIDKELYKCSGDGQIAQGIYHLVSMQDPDIGMMFAWANSYNRLTRFKCAVGARVFVCDNGMVNGDLASYSRVHKGAGTYHHVMHTISGQIANAHQHFASLIDDKEMLKNVLLTRSQRAGILGELFAAEEALTINQVSVVKQQMDKPSFDYGVDPDSAWAMYNHVTIALKESHPMNYLKDHEKVHRFFTNLVQPVYQPEPLLQPVFEDEQLSGTVDVVNTNTFGVMFS